jgi:hypothetical protein
MKIDVKKKMNAKMHAVLYQSHRRRSVKNDSEHCRAEKIDCSDLRTPANSLSPRRERGAREPARLQAATDSLHKFQPFLPAAHL